MQGQNTQSVLCIQIIPNLPSLRAHKIIFNQFNWSNFKLKLRNIRAEAQMNTYLSYPLLDVSVKQNQRIFVSI